MVKITGRSNAIDKTIPQKSSLIHSDDCILTGISRLFKTIQADGECQGDSQILLIDANIPGQEPSDTGHPDIDTAHNYTGSKYAKPCVLKILSLVIWWLLLALYSTTTISPKKQRAIL